MESNETFVPPNSISRVLKIKTGMSSSTSRYDIKTILLMNNFVLLIYRKAQK